MLESIYLILLLLLALFVLPRFCGDLGFSIFYNPTSSSYAQVAADNEKRADAASNYMLDHHEEFSAELSDRLNASGTEFCVLVISVRRPENPRYLTQVVARLIPQLLQLNNFSFCIYNPEGALHQEAMKLAPYVPIASRKMKRDNNLLDKYDAERRDYVAALQWCLTKGAHYNIILEDDALPDLLFVQKLRFVIDHRLPFNEHSWAMLKLFYPEKYQGWGDSASVTLELIFVVMSSGIVIALFSALTIPGPLCISCQPPTIQISWTLAVIRCVFSMGFVLYIMLALGRPHWEELKKVSPYLARVVEARGCCTPAMLYPAEHLPQLVEYLNSVHCTSAFPIDIAIDKFAKENHLHKFLTIPNLVRHIGMVSSLPKSHKNVKEFQLLFDP